MLLFKAEAEIQCRLHKVASCLPADSAKINTNMKWVPDSNYAAKHTHTKSVLEQFNNLMPSDLVLLHVKNIK